MTLMEMMNLKSKMRMATNLSQNKSKSSPAIFWTLFPVSTSVYNGWHVSARPSANLLFFLLVIRVKKISGGYSGTPLKSGKKPKFVVHAAGDVGISGDGYRWRKYGQKMVKGNPHPRYKLFHILCCTTIYVLLFWFDGKWASFFIQLHKLWLLTPCVGGVSMSCRVCMSLFSLQVKEQKGNTHLQ